MRADEGRGYVSLVLIVKVGEETVEGESGESCSPILRTLTAPLLYSLPMFEI